MESKLPHQGDTLRVWFCPNCGNCHGTAPVGKLRCSYCDSTGKAIRANITIDIIVSNEETD